MPPREPKARLLTREYVADRDFMVSLTPAEREWYLLTSLYADDAGFLEWNLEENAANLYRFESPRAREKRVGAFVAKLTLSERFIVLPCGKHAHMPRVAKRPRSGGREWSIRDAHNVENGRKRVDRKSTRVDSRVNSQSTHVLSSPVQSSPVESRPARARAREGGAARGLSPLRQAIAGTPFGEAYEGRVAAKSGPGSERKGVPTADVLLHPDRLDVEPVTAGADHSRGSKR